VVCVDANFIRKKMIIERRVVINLPTKYKYKKGGQVKASRFVKEVVQKQSNEEIMDVINSLREEISELAERLDCIAMDVTGELSAVSDGLNDSLSTLDDLENLIQE
jgi:phosphoglycerate-specific signal transduction histidine kinase